jgi:uncharacterized phiE125 gp8 family phage protein
MVAYNSVLDLEFNDGVIIEPITLAETKDFCKIDIDTDDALIEQLIVIAREMSEDYTNIGFIEHQITAVVNNINGGIFIPYGPIIEIIQVTNSRGDILILDTNYTLQGNQFKRLMTPCQTDITIVYQAGYTELPLKMKLALLNTVYYLYDNRAQSINHIYDKNVPTIGNLGPISEMLLKPLRRVI